MPTRPLRIGRNFPGMNANRCIKCLVHGEESDHGSPNCSRADCDCRKCELMALRREAMHKMKGLSKKNAIDFGVEEIFHTRYTCSKCRHHGVMAIKKFHVPCPFAVCECEWCQLNEKKRVIDAELMKIQRAEKRGECPHSPTSSDSGDSPMDYEQNLSPEAKVIHSLLTLLSLSPSSFDPSTFDYQALSNFFALPLITLPEEWVPQIDTIVELVHEALKRFPVLQGVDVAPYSHSYAPQELYSPCVVPYLYSYPDQITPLATPAAY
ncbi:hypothetical protein PRIPAC_82756 [Pristionchus pacificus]|uniref:DM domain-containing protein n=1 Tax=Pristionchus pacificus TaxID=54126 RepID=A0A2A6BVQ8_PRIPA|nr:hypothetical protein PRIPAC_82756 [Pristionchus pacificus]|eukprot:PDM69948.1 hypothetical protein PRIPAC_49160 [Pristionchus pacificus]